METKLAIIGAGNLGTSFVKGLLQSENYLPANFFLTRRNVLKLNPFEALGCEISSNNLAAIKTADIIVLAVLPQKINEVLDEISKELKSDQLLISLVSGVKISHIQERIGNDIPVIRAMPNTAIAIRESMTCLCTVPAFESKMVIAIDLFEMLGETVVINEEQMTSATALCACGIAFFLRAIRAASQGGNEIDFHASEALKMAAQTAKGAASLLIANNSHPEDEIDKVTSPKGCTIAGLNEMEHNGFSSAFIKGIKVSA
ncbi:MAG: pyrroline-5-carboxylate reductase, partial [Chitinophagales bacterium]